jgi:hypothetical protein
LRIGEFSVAAFGTAAVAQSHELHFRNQSQRQFGSPLRGGGSNALSREGVFFGQHNLMDADSDCQNFRKYIAPAFRQGPYRVRNLEENRHEGKRR